MAQALAENIKKKLEQWNKNIKYYEKHLCKQKQK